mgnify:CR=1 FL=1
MSKFKVMPVIRGMGSDFMADALEKGRLLGLHKQGLLPIPPIVGRISDRWGRFVRPATSVVPIKELKTGAGKKKKKKATRKKRAVKRSY